MEAQGNHYLIRKLHSLTGIIPIGYFVLMHLLTGGANRPDSVVSELAFIWIPLAFHGGYGAYLLYSMEVNLGTYKFYRNWLYIVQRASAVLLAVFIVTHMASARFGNGFDLSSAPMIIWYVLGVLSATFHLANGFWTFCITWGITVGPRAQKIVGIWTVIFFVALSFAGINALTDFM